MYKWCEIQNKTVVMGTESKLCIIQISEQVTWDRQCSKNSDPGEVRRRCLWRKTVSFRVSTIHIIFP